MSLNQLPYDRALPLVRANLCFDETPKTTALIRELREARRRGYLRPRELEAICRWKSPRAIKLIQSNTAHAVRSVTRAVLATRSERQKLETLTQLSGVSRPMAWAVLMLLDPKRYGVTDIRVWELLHTLGTVTKNPRGKGFGFNNWYQYLMIIRYFAKVCGCTARDVERTLFFVHRKFQDGLLYPGRRHSL